MTLYMPVQTAREQGGKGPARKPAPDYPIQCQEYDIAAALSRAIKAGRLGRRDTIWKGSHLLAKVRRDAEILALPDAIGICHSRALSRDPFHNLLRELLPSEERGNRGDVIYRTAGLKAAARRGGELWRFLRDGQQDYQMTRLRWRRDVALHTGNRQLAEWLDADLARLERPDGLVDVGAGVMLPAEVFDLVKR